MSGEEKATVRPSGKGLAALFPEDTTPRRLLVFFSAPVLLAAAALAGVGFSLDSAPYRLAGTAVWIIWFAVMFAVTNPDTDRRLERRRAGLNKGARAVFITLLAVGVIELFVLGIFSYWYVNTGANNNVTVIFKEIQSAFRYNDGTALNQQATENLLAGKNPYANANITETFKKFNGHYDRLTPLRTGSFANVFPYPTHEQMKAIWDKALTDPANPPPELESEVCYPAGAFLLPAPFIAAGLKDIRIIYFILAVLGLGYTIWKMPAKSRWMFTALAVISIEVWNVLAVGESGTIIFPFLLVGWILIGRNNWLSAVFMGIAVATKQIAWFFLPFYIILMWRTAGAKTAAAGIGIIAGVFAVFNGYFIALDAGLWLKGVTAPVVERMFPLGVGIISLVNSGIINVRSSWPFSVMEIAVWAGGGIWYIFNCKKYPDTGPVLAVLPLFLAWRSLWTYFFYVTLIVFAAMCMRDGEEREVTTAK